jgi:hypothetical protein
VADIPDRLFCDRSRHELARVEVVAGGARRVVVRWVMPGARGFTLHETTFESDVLNGESTLMLDAGCSCGRTYLIDIAGPIRGVARLKAKRTRPITNVSGVSPDMNRAASRTISDRDI